MGGWNKNDTVYDEEIVSHGHSLTGQFSYHPGFVSRFLDAPRDVIVYLPPQYDWQPEARFPVLYMQDGQNLFDGATSFVPGQEWQVDETAETLIRNGEIEPVIIVGIYNTGDHRIDEYTPTRDAFSRGGKAHLYARLLIEELKPMIDGSYRTRPGARDTGLGGSSLGGLVTLAIGLTHPEVFGKLAVHSPSIWWDRRVILDVVRDIKQKPNQRIWLDVGTQEGTRTHLDARRLRDALRKKRWRIGEDLAYMEAEGAGHNEAAWAHRVGPMLRWLFPPPPVIDPGLW